MSRGFNQFLHSLNRGAIYKVNKYKLIYKQYDKYFYKNFSRKRLTANLFRRIVRFFAADEAAVTK
ncbi:hypothetical protein NEICINOT_05101 [Neisseria cinerea ATCC 14685]|uniref:Uncharacterized protein n=1 Tax=Neisseria cinerea ATCC 14685 TaxID=546262 RepID=D0W5X5_NEICI|nr:hypothetical protein NEICINOT_05101 [Neisseria cinerea ATCC 14685]